MATSFDLCRPSSGQNIYKNLSAVVYNALFVNVMGSHLNTTEYPVLRSCELCWTDFEYLKNLRESEKEKKEKMKKMWEKRDEEEINFWIKENTEVINKQNGKIVLIIFVFRVIKWIAQWLLNICTTRLGTQEVRVYLCSSYDSCKNQRLFLGVELKVWSS
jgi:hypothetical protein